MIVTTFLVWTCSKDTSKTRFATFSVSRSEETWVYCSCSFGCVASHSNSFYSSFSQRG